MINRCTKNMVMAHRRELNERPIISMTGVLMAATGAFGDSTSRSDDVASLHLSAMITLSKPVKDQASRTPLLVMTYKSETIMMISAKGRQQSGQARDHQARLFDSFSRSRAKANAVSD